MLRFFIVLLIAVGSGAHADADNVLFIGNSLTGVNNMPGVFLGLARSRGLSPSVSVSLQFGQTLAVQLADAKVRAYISARQWDSVILQEYSDLPLRDVVSFEKSVVEFKALVPGAHVFLFENWPYSDADTSVLPKLDHAYEKVSAASGATVVHIGRAIDHLRRRTEIGVYVDDRHPQPIATYAGALMLLDAVYGLSPTGLAAHGSSTSTSAVVLGDAVVSTWIDFNDDDTRLVQETAVRFK